MDNLSKIKSVSYNSHWAKTVLPQKRIWCLLKLNYINHISKWIVAQWDPFFKNGCWILCNSARTIITLDNAQYYIEHFTILE